jgi:hypothetical protein
VTARDRLVLALGGLDLTPGSVLRLTSRAAERIADLALDAIPSPAEPLRPAREVALDLVVLTGVHEDSAAARALVDQVEHIRREAIGVAYAEGREDRDRLRRELDEVRELLAEVVTRADGMLGPVRGKHAPTRLAEVLDRARARLRQ